MMARNKADRLMVEFVARSKDALRNYDRMIYRNLRKSKNKDFYQEEWKGIGILGITEPFLRFLISSELCKTYRIRPERQYDDGSKFRADLGIYLDDESYEEGSPPHITIEMKWGVFLGRNSNRGVCLVGQ